MASEIQLPCDEDGVCMRCKLTPSFEECLTCIMCATPWHASCLSSPPGSLEATRDWQCPDCSGDVDLVPDSRIEFGGSTLVASIRAIEIDESLTEAEKARKRQQLMSGMETDVEEEEEENEEEVDDAVLSAFRENLNCAICLELPDRPVSTSCGHNFCSRCFEKWIGGKKYTCAKCRRRIPKEERNPQINYVLESAIRIAKDTKCASVNAARAYHYIRNQDRPDEAFTTERAKKAGLANASSGRIFVTIPGDHFGPITAEHDPKRNQGVLVGESWTHRHGCRQWGVHNPLVSGIAGQSKHGAQSVVLAFGYEEDEDHGDWFLYTGSGGRDLSGNKRTNNKQAYDQEFSKGNAALRVSCKMGYPVRVVRSEKQMHSEYRPKEGVRYDGVYRIEKCWRKVCVQGVFKICRYLFVRCDNEASPWASDGLGDRPRPLPDIPELSEAIDLFVRTESPSWDFDETEGRWKWVKPPPASLKAAQSLGPAEKKIKRKTLNVRDKLLKEFNCQICRQVMSLPVTTPCGHNFCKTCLEDKFAGISQVRDRSRGGRTLRAQKNVKKCHCCPNDLSDFLQNPQVNREVMEIIERLKKKEEKLPVEDDASMKASEENSKNTTKSNSQGKTDSEGEEKGETDVDVSEAEPTIKKMKITIAGSLV